MSSALSRFMRAIRSVESNGDYQAIGPATRYGRASGAYQFIDSTWAGYGGYRSAYLAPPEVQDRAARALMSRYYREFGRWDLVAVAWHAGEGTARRVRNNPDGLRGIGDGYISTAGYVRRVMARAGIGRHDRPGTGHSGHSRGGHSSDLRPWQVPRNSTGRAGRIVIDTHLLGRLARRLTDQLAIVETAYHRCDRAADDLDRRALTGSRDARRLKTALREALDDWHGLRRLPHLLSRDIGFVVEARQRALGADADDRRARRTVEGLIGSLAGRHGRGTRSHVAELLRNLYRNDRLSGHVRQHLPTTPDHGGGRAPARVDSLSDVRLGRAWGGTASIFRQFVTPFLHERGLRAGSTKRDYDTVRGPAMSDHYEDSLQAYATDYPTNHGEDAARQLAHAMGNRSWRPNSDGTFTITVDGQRFRVQILWGARIDHADHVHVGIRRI